MIQKNTEIIYLQRAMIANQERRTLRHKWILAGSRQEVIKAKVDKKEKTQGFGSYRISYLKIVIRMRKTQGQLLYTGQELKAC